MAALVFWLSPGLVLRAVVAPSAPDDRPAWQVQYYAGEKPFGPALRQDRAAADQAVVLERPNTSLIAYGLLKVAGAGVYRLGLECDDYGSLHLDGRPLIQLRGISARNLAWTRVELDSAPHLLRVDLHNGPGQGFFRLRILRPGQGEDEDDWPRAGELLRPDLGNLDNWWAWLVQMNSPYLVTLVGLAALAVMLALPLAARPAWQGGAALVILLLAPAMLLAGPGHKHPFEYGPTIQDLQKQQPDYVFIGNSMVDSAMDFERLAGLTGGGRSMALTMGGTRSAVHFLFFKNVLLASGIHPRATFVFFRDNALTNPLLRTGSPGDRAIFESLSPGPEPLMEELVYARRPWRQRLGEGLKGLLRASSLQVQGRDALSLLAQTMALGGREPDHDLRKMGLPQRANQRFALDRLRAGTDEAALAQAETFVEGRFDHDLYLDFDRVRDASFLPPWIALAKEQGLRLIFIRHQRRPDAQGRPPGDAKLDAYLERLRDYLSRAGVGFHDFTGDPQLPLALYGAGDHISGDGSTRYTEVFFERLQGRFLP